MPLAPSMPRHSRIPGRSPPTSDAASTAARSAMPGDPAPGTAADPRRWARQPIDEPWLRGYPLIEPETLGLQGPAAMRHLIDGEQAAIKNRVRETYLAAFLPLLRRHGHRGTAREGVRVDDARLRGREFGFLFMPKIGRWRAMISRGFMAAFETLGFHDISLVIKFGVQFGLWGGSVLRSRHSTTIIKNICPATATVDLPGCFAMTEIGHGSNVRDIETVARYDPARRANSTSPAQTFTSGKKLHRQRAVPRADRDRFRATPDARRAATASTPSSCRSATRRATPARRAHWKTTARNSASTAWTTRRIWFDGMCGWTATELLDRLRAASRRTALIRVEHQAAPAARFFTTH